jgi:SAM-dependent methyltransferase
MLPLIGALVHPEPRSALVVGLGTGESAGWLAEVDSIRRVDVVEIEPLMAHVAQACAAANRNALDNPKLSLIYDDAREFLLTSPNSYDLIISEPSNPYRTGVAGLYTQEFYRSLLDRLNQGGLFLQWLQTYEIDARSVRTVMATLSLVFPEIELWQSKAGDLVFVCGLRQRTYSAESLRAKLLGEPFSSAMANVWHTADLEGFLAHYLAGRKLITAVIAARQVPINTDDKNILEYGLARTLGRRNLFSLRELTELAGRLGADRPRIDGDVDWPRVTDERLLASIGEGEEISPLLPLDRDQELRVASLRQYLAGHMDEAVQLWEAQETPSVSLAGKRLLAHAYSEQGSLLADPWVARLSLIQPTDAEFLSALLAARSGRPELATTRLAAAFERLRSDPWSQRIADRGLSVALELAATDPGRARRLHAALAEPFAVRVLDSRRLATKLTIAQMLPSPEQLEDFLAFEPYVPWTRGFLESRQKIYEANKHPLAAKAARDLQAFIRAADDSSLLPSHEASESAVRSAELNEGAH